MPPANREGVLHTLCDDQTRSSAWKRAGLITCDDQTVGSMARVYSHAREDELITT
jgi:hypothetical protein